MDNCILKINNVSKKYKNVKVLYDINMTIKKGKIYGFIGLNGAGKSTLMKIITGLVKGDNGSIELFGEHEKSKIQKSRNRIGSIIEKPGFYENETVYENMYINKLQKGIPGEGCIDKILDLLRLKEVKDKKVKNLSLGTKQILGIAMAMLGEPEFLILDEPINGLDPVRIIEVRELLKKLNVEFGVTILISSHILEELYQVANCFGIIHKGKIVEEISKDKLEDKCRKFIHIKVDNASKAAVIINSELNTSEFNVMPDNIINLYDYVDDSGKVTEMLVKEGIVVEQIMPMCDDLEHYFTRVIEGVKNV